MNKKTIFELCLDQLKSISCVENNGTSYIEIGLELWKRLNPIFKRLSDEMKEKSKFKQSSIWVLDETPYNFVLCESINKTTGELGLKIGIRSQGTFIDETFYIPKDIETMEWDDLVEWAIKNDSIVVPPGWHLGADGNSIERNKNDVLIFGRRCSY